MNGIAAIATKSDIRNGRCDETIVAVIFTLGVLSAIHHCRRCIAAATISIMKRYIRIAAPFAAALTATVTTAPTPAFADIRAQSDNGFAVFHVAIVDAQPDVIWKRLITPKEYWSKTHSWSGSVDGFTLDPRAGGCFCEFIQEKDAKDKMKITGSVEHMRVIFVQPNKVLRMQGALGPLQSEAMMGTLTVAINPVKDGIGTMVSFSYVAGGYMRYKVADIAPAVDKVIGEQFAGLIMPYAVTETIAEQSDDPDARTASEPDLAPAPIPAPAPRKPNAVKPSTKKSAAPNTGGIKPKPKLPPAKPLDDTSR
jgi:hypothetical protein